ncbi:hypothetical protein CHS0354_001721 [Potamilus streckersoni]|uniref:Uncharacterized protein n=1 Tax=Potamilus streckersoni TaxID=2493646 RepID=A0AAE0VNR1_9BIVA|nr:hypothetical protein CHS0354_001721 [Potamilus streckersoni]
MSITSAVVVVFLVGLAGQQARAITTCKYNYTCPVYEYCTYNTRTCDDICCDDTTKSYDAVCCTSNTVVVAGGTTVGIIAGLVLLCILCYLWRRSRRVVTTVTTVVY